MDDSSSSNPALDDSRIKDYHDQRLLEYIRSYYQCFRDNPEGMKNLQTEQFTASDVPVGIINVNRDVFCTAGKAFRQHITDLRATGLNLYGSSAPGSHSVLEVTITFKLTTNPPPEYADHLPPGAKAGDTVRQVGVDIMWWDEDGKLARELVYGRLAWKGFRVEDYDRPSRE